MRSAVGGVVLLVSLTGCVASHPAPYTPAPTPDYSAPPDSYSPPEEAPTATVNGDCYAACTDDDFSADQCNNVCLGKTDADIDADCQDECMELMADDAYCRGDCMFRATDMTQ